VEARLPLRAEAAFGRVSAPVPATHCQLPLLEATSPSIRCAMKWAAPRRQPIPRLATAARHDRPAAALLAPYLAWTLFATALNAAVRRPD
jgi:hypothetical protein